VVSGVWVRNSFLMAVLCGGLLATSGCSGAVASPTAEQISAPTTVKPAASPNAMTLPTPTSKLPEAAATTAVDEVLGVMRAAHARRSFRARMETEVNGEAGGFDLEFVAPDRYRMRGKGFEFIIIGQDGYVKMENIWQRAPRDEADDSHTFNVGNAPVFWGAAAATKLKPLTTVKNVSETTVEGHAQKLFEYEMKDALGHQGRNFSRTWVSLPDGLPRKTEVFGDYEGTKSRAVLTWLEYDANLKIEAPVIQSQH
jgi:hypothetical protein